MSPYEKGQIFVIIGGLVAISSFNRWAGIIIGIVIWALGYSRMWGWL